MQASSSSGAGSMLIMSLRKPEGVATLDQIGTYGYVAESVGGAEDTGRRPLDSLAGRLGDTAAKRIGRFSETEVRQKLVSAGMYGTTPRKVLGYQVLASIFLTLLALWGIPLLGYSFVLAIVGAIAGGLIGWFLPMVYVDRTMRQRFERIDRQMPDMIDLLVVTIEAGSRHPRLDARRVRTTPGSARAGDPVDAPGAAYGPLRLRGDHQPRSAADTPNMRMFVRSLTQGEAASRSGRRCGTSQPRCASGGRPWQRKAQKMPIKLLFPLVFLIFGDHDRAPRAGDDPHLRSAVGRRRPLAWAR